LSYAPGETRSPVVYWHVVRGLILRALGDAEGLREEYLYAASHGKERSPVAFVSRELGLTSDLDDGQIAAVFERVLKRSRGLRRGADYERCSWMR
jgi:hypothetical protein